jgi:outer membrane cobalamin receptor
VRAALKILSLICLSSSLLAQSDLGELRLKVTDPDGLGLASVVQVVSEANQYQKSFHTDEAGNLVAKHLPFGLYRLEIQRSGFAPLTDSVEVRSSIPTEHHAVLHVATVTSSIEVNDVQTLVDPTRIGSVNRIGDETLQKRTNSLPGRSLQDLIVTQPGWLYEGNAVLHPRGSEYQTQVVVDGVPLTDDRSPSFGPEIATDDIESVSVYTAGIPAEYGRKMGGIVELNTARDTRMGWHGLLDLSGGSFNTAGAYGAMQYSAGKNTFALSADGAQTDRYLNPPVLENFTNTATTGSFAGSFERDLTNRDRLNLQVRHELSRFLVPNELLQQAAGQRQDRDNFETMGIVSYQHVFSPDMVSDFHGMVRDDSGTLNSNANSTPVMAFQDRGFREGYFKGTISLHRGRHEWKAGVESDATWLHEQFQYVITDPSQFPPDTPTTFPVPFHDTRLDLEQSFFVQDRIHAGNWNISAGLRYDHYQLLVNQHAVSPRLGISRYFSKGDFLLHASYDRVFQTPAFENILLSSSPMVVSLSDEVLRLPVKPSLGNYFEVGATKGFLQRLRADLNGYYRNVNNFADDDQLLDTGVSFPISFRKAHIYGAEAKLEVPHWGAFSGFVSYSYMVGSAYLPVTGGLFLGAEAADALSNTSGRFWVTQDQRHTVYGRLRYQLTSRVWLAGGAQYGSGLPVEFEGTPQEAAAQYGPQIIERVDFASGRVRPSVAVDASAGAELFHRDRWRMQLQADGINLNNRLNLINFAGLFSGNAIAPPRSFALRLQTIF